MSRGNAIDGARNTSYSLLVRDEGPSLSRAGASPRPAQRLGTAAVAALLAASCAGTFAEGTGNGQFTEHGFDQKTFGWTLEARGGACSSGTTTTRRTSRRGCRHSTASSSA